MAVVGSYIVSMSNASEAIHDSIREDRIVHLRHDDLAESDLSELLIESDDMALTDGDGESIQEYWGELGGDEWRVHVHVALRGE